MVAKEKRLLPCSNVFMSVSMSACALSRSMRDPACPCNVDSAASEAIAAIAYASRKGCLHMGRHRSQLDNSKQQLLSS